MCGIVGFVGNTVDNFFSENLLDHMIQNLAHRGPDNSGKWIAKDKNIYFGHTRLSIIDLSTNGNQPMVSKSSRYIISYNGEIYNHLVLRKKKLPNYPWRGTSDTETLIELIEKFGLDETLKNIDGMFSFALYDKFESKIYLVRDKIGEKPLYYGLVKNYLVFSSELHPFKKLNLNINFDAISAYLKYQYIPAPLSIYKNIFKLKPGCYISLNIKDISNISNIKSNRWWDIKNLILNGKKNIITDENITNITKTTIEKSVKQQMISDVPIGSFLSGGLDSSLVTSLMTKISSNKIKTFTIGVKDNEYDESIFARKISKELNTDHHEYILSNKDILDKIYKIINSFDEPFADSSQIPTYLISYHARKHVKVCLTGDGGDEVFGGYNRYLWSKNINLLLNLTPFYLRKLLAQILLKFPRKINIMIFKVILNIFNLSKDISLFSDKTYKFLMLLKNLKNFEDLYSYLITEWKYNDNLFISSDDYYKGIQKPLKLDGLNMSENMMLNDTIYYLPDDIMYKVDRSSMSNSLETRAPLLGKKVLELAWKIPFNKKISGNKFGKKIIADVLKDFLPSELFIRPKMGFSIPISNWLRSEMKEFTYDTIISNKNIIKDYLNEDIILKNLDDHMNFKKDSQYKLWSLVVLFNWLSNKQINL